MTTTKFYISAKHTGNFVSYSTLAGAKKRARAMRAEGYENITITAFPKGGIMQIVHTINH